MSLIFGLFFLLFPLAVLAVVFGHTSLSEIKKSDGKIAGRGLAITGLVLGYIGLSITPILILAAIAIPNLLRAKLAANEVSAAASIRALTTAEVVYATRHPDLGFSCNLADLQLNADLATGKKYGYLFHLQNCQPRNSGGPIVRFQALAIPEQINETGTRMFCSDESLLLKYAVSTSPEECLEFGMAVR